MFGRAGAAGAGCVVLDRRLRGACARACWFWGRAGAGAGAGSGGSGAGAGSAFSWDVLVLVRLPLLLLDRRFVLVCWCRSWSLV